MVGTGFQATPLLKSCSYELTLQVEQDFKGGRKLFALNPIPRQGSKKEARARKTTRPELPTYNLEQNPRTTSMNEVQEQGTNNNYREKLPIINQKSQEIKI
ncbi:hypothetical protein R50345_08590 [Paenibacillus sp. FSL R5-0345]|nr:hypothetical protein R50345_08590 [Paenibacillus sp. FSL R5-0345]